VSLKSVAFQHCESEKNETSSFVHNCRKYGPILIIINVKKLQLKFDIFERVEMPHLKRQKYFVKIENAYDLTYELYAEMSSAPYCKVVFVIFLS